jgi:PAS domain S-box-containing protein
MLAGALSVLPIRAMQAIIVGLSMYLIYVATVLARSGSMDNAHLIYAVNNSFFFLAIVGITAVQCYDDLNTHVKELRVKRSIQNLHSQLTAYTDNLEETVQQRLAELAESDLRYRDLYNNLQDLIVLVDAQGVIRKINQQSAALFGRPPEEMLQRDIGTLLKTAKDGDVWLTSVQSRLERETSVQGIQLLLENQSGDMIEVELSANRVEIDNHSLFQLILRDISATKTMERKLLDSQRLIGTSRQAAIFGLAKLAECRDEETGAHLSRIRTYTRILAEELARWDEFKEIVTEDFIEDIYTSSVLHDIGKVGIPDAILLKPGTLTVEEYELMKLHTVFGSDVLAVAETGTESISFLRVARDITRSHHERWDATGYPDGLSGNAIPLAARIISVADVYDALTSSRVYKPPFSHDESRDMIAEQSGKQFDPRMVTAFLRRELDFKEARIQLVLQQAAQEHEQPEEV